MPTRIPLSKYCWHAYGSGRCQRCYSLITLGVVRETNEFPGRLVTRQIKHELCHGCARLIMKQPALPNGTPLPTPPAETGRPDNCPGCRASLYRASYP